MAQATGSDQWESGSGDDGKQGKGTGKTSGKPSGKGKGKGSDTTAMGKGTSSDSCHGSGGNPTWLNTDTADRATGWSNHSWNETGAALGSSGVHPQHYHALVPPELQQRLDNLPFIASDMTARYNEARAAAHAAQHYSTQLQGWQASFEASTLPGFCPTCHKWCPINPDVCLNTECTTNPIRQLTLQIGQSHDKLAAAIDRLTSSQAQLHSQVQPLVSAQSGQMPATSSSATTEELADLRSKVQLLQTIIGNMHVMPVMPPPRLPPQLHQLPPATMPQHMQGHGLQPHHTPGHLQGHGGCAQQPHSQGAVGQCPAARPASSQPFDATPVASESSQATGFVATAKPAIPVKAAPPAKKAHQPAQGVPQGVHPNVGPVPEPPVETSAKRKECPAEDTSDTAMEKQSRTSDHASSG